MVGTVSDRPRIGNDVGSSTFSANFCQIRVGWSILRSLLHGANQPGEFDRVASISLLLASGNDVVDM